jgi:signal transduction histidine kinase
MTFEAIRDLWMRVGTQDKAENPVSPRYKRLRTGAKGVGRFAVRKLGEKLTLHSVAERDNGRKEEVTVEFDWTKDFGGGQLLNEIPVSYQRRVVGHDTPTGVILYIRDAKDVWGEEDVSELRRDLLSLASPSQGVNRDKRRKSSRGATKYDPGFSFKLEAPEFPAYEGDIGDQFLSASWGTLTGQVDKEGRAHYHFKVTRSKEEFDYVLEEEAFTDLIDAQFLIYFFVYKKEYFEEFDFPTSHAQRMGREAGGVRIYLDDFRVFPYGDPSDDWLKLNDIRARRTPQLLQPPISLRELGKYGNDRPELLTPGNNQLFGSVEISRLKNSKIEVNVSRERFIENEAFTALRRFVLLGIYWMTVQYGRITYPEREARRGKRKEDTSTTNIIEEAKELLEQVKHYAIPDQSAAIKSLEVKLNYAMARSEKEREERISELSLLRVLASAGTTVSVMHHQLREVIDGVRNIYNDLLDLEPKVPSSAKTEFRRLLEQAQTWREQAENQVGLISILLGEDARHKRKRTPLRTFVDKIQSSFLMYMRDYRITFTNDVPANVRTPPMFEAELGAVFFNVMSNSLKAVRTTGQKQICVQGKRESGEMVIEILDTGIGVEEARRETVFKPFVTTSTPDPILGVGTGIGLKVVRDIVESYNGNVQFIEPSPPWATCLEIRIPE